MIAYKNRKKIALILLVVMLAQMLEAPVAYALTSGPSQPEVQSFEPAGTTEMVDLFTGDFTYNIPLFELPGPNGGYPFNLSYHAGITMDQEASWAGLGWNLNPGAITRQMRGLPDEFKGDPVSTKMSMDKSVTVGVGAGMGFELFGKNLGLNVGLSVYNNNYKGVGYSIDGSLGYGFAVGSGTTGNIGLGFNLDSEMGANLRPSLSLGQFDNDWNASVSTSYNAREGLGEMTLSAFNPERKSIVGTKDGFKVRTEQLTGVSSTISLASPGYTPQVSLPMRNNGFTGTFKAGGSFAAAFPNANFSGFYNQQSLVNDKVSVPYPAYGYMHYQDGIEDGQAMLDFNREKDAIVSEESPNLAIPSLTYDIFSVTGQGMSMMYRAMRNDMGTIHDQVIETESATASLGIDAAPALAHVGVNAQAMMNSSYSGPWRDSDNISSRLSFQNAQINNAYEPWYFKVHGEPVSTIQDNFVSIGGMDDPVRVDLSGGNSNPQASTTLENESGFNNLSPASNQSNRNRAVRGQVIQSLTNAEIMDSTALEVDPLFKVEYITHNETLAELDRSQYPEHHTAGMVTLSADGLRYYYALPAYNHHQEEVQFSAERPDDNGLEVEVGDNGDGDPVYEYDDTQKYLKRTEIPDYPHSYMLTSIVGPDYVDVTGDGVSEDDLGYWVKFTYQRLTDQNNLYKWRAPFTGGLYNEGYKTDPRDDMGSFTYGEKDVWYLAKAETKSHIAEFNTTPRDDSRGVYQKLQDAGDNTIVGGRKLEALQSIKLYTRAAGSNMPLVTVKLDYDYSLCQGLPNRDGASIINGQSQTGKLTLKKLWFEYGNSSRGQLTPYEFSYNTLNPDYSLNAFDRWGQYKPVSTSDPLMNHDFPYVEQESDSASKATLDLQAAAWSLSEIRMPSGGKIMVDYEVDDYAYVQHRPAMQMANLMDPSGEAVSVASNDTYLASDDNLKVRFKLEEPIEIEMDTEKQKAYVRKHLDLDKKGQIYFKAMMSLRKAEEDAHEFIAGYANVDLEAPMELEEDSNGDYAYGSFYLEKEDGRHPFSLRAWQHLRVNQPEMANFARKMKPTDDDDEKVKMMKGMTSIIPQVRQLFEGFYDYCDNKSWGREVVLDKAWIRLVSPDKIKYGGGLRVKQVTMSDEWQHDSEGLYGQVYNYTKEEDGETISSGVAANEPLQGGDENALHYAKPFTDSAPLRSDYHLFFEYPINESYYPGAQVGYSKVTVKSLAAAALAEEEVLHADFPQGEGVSYGTTGATMHEFYTAKDFPVIARETEKDDEPYNISIPIPFLGGVNTSRLTSTQGYSILTNDMHGRPKKVSAHKQAKSGEIAEEPYSWTAYHYASEDDFYDGHKVATLDNRFEDNGDHMVSRYTEGSNGELMYMGQEVEFFADMREHEDKTWTVGADYNVDIVIAFFPFTFPSVWPGVSREEKQLRTVVTNKVIFRSGVLESIESYHEGSKTTLTHLKWDKLTGKPLLTQVNNNFDEPIYSYSLPAYTEYSGMGPAYQNIGYYFDIQDVAVTPYKDDIYRFDLNASADEDLMIPGDEWIVYAKNTLEIMGKGIYIGKEDGEMRFYSETNFAEAEYEVKILRSGNRNQLNVEAESVQALQNPIIEGPPVFYEKQINISENQ